MVEFMRFNELQELQRKLEDLNEQIANMDQESAGTGGIQSKSLLSSRYKTDIHPQYGVGNSIHEVDFPRFDGFNTRAWVIKCDIYFKITVALSDENKMKVAINNFEGKALVWIQTLGCENVLGITWEQFLEVVAARFEELDERKIIMNFMNLKQIGSYDDDVEKYKELKACLLLSNGVSYFEEYLVASFIHALSHEMQEFMLLSEPKDLQDVFESEQKMISIKGATDFSRKVQGHEFNFPPSNEGHVLVIGSKWLKFGTVLDHMKMIFTMCLGGRKVKFKATTNKVGLHLISTENLLHLDVSEESYLGNFKPPAIDPHESASLTSLQGGLKDLFEELSRLSPAKENKDQVSLKSDFIQHIRKVKLRATTHIDKFQLIHPQDLFHLMQFCMEEEDEGYLIDPESVADYSDVSTGIVTLLEEFKDALEKYTPQPPAREAKYQVLLKHESVLRHHFSYIIIHRNKAENEMIELEMCDPAAVPNWVKLVTQSYARDAHFTQIISAMTIDPPLHPEFQEEFGILMYKERVVIFFTKELRTLVLKEVRNKSFVGQAGVQGNAAIRVMVDKLNQYGDLLHPPYLFNTQSVAEVFFNNVDNFHGFPMNIVSDWDKILTSIFWKKLFKLGGSKMAMSSAYFLESEKQIKNLCLQVYLRCIVGRTPKRWYNLFQTLYGIFSSHTDLRAYPSSTNQKAYELNFQMQSVIQFFKENLRNAQARMKSLTNKNRSEHIFEVGGYVYLKLHLPRRNFVSLHRNLKLSAKNYGLCGILEKIRTVAYKLALLANYRVHSSFNVSLLKKCVEREITTSVELSDVDADGHFKIAPFSILKNRAIVRRGMEMPQSPMCCSVGGIDATSWEGLRQNHRSFSAFADPVLDFYVEACFKISLFSVLARQSTLCNGLEISYVLVQGVIGGNDATNWKDSKQVRLKLPIFTDPWGQGSQRGEGIVMTMGSVALENEGFGLGKSGMGSGIDLVASEIEGGKGLASAIEGEKGFVLEIEGEKGYAEEIGVCRQEDIVNEKWLLFKKIEVETSAGP